MHASDLFKTELVLLFTFLLHFIEVISASILIKFKVNLKYSLRNHVSEVFRQVLGKAFGH